MNEAALDAWIVIAQTGEIQCRHCTCMAGLAETCSHLGAVCFYFNYSTERQNDTSVTDVKAYWANIGGTLKITNKFFFHYLPCDS